MKVIATKYLKVCKKASFINSKSSVILSPGSMIEVDPKPIKGSVHNKINLWYKGLDGNYYWSGGVKKVTRLSAESIDAGLGNYSNAEIAKLAIQQHKLNVLKKFPNISIVSDAVHDLNSVQTYVISFYLKDKNSKGFPDKLKVNLPDGNKALIATEIIKNTGTAKLHYSQLETEVANTDKPNYTGSICCAVKYADRNDFTGLLTSAHIYTLGSYDDSYNGLLNKTQQKDALLNNTDNALWYLKVMTSKQDLGIIKLNTPIKGDTHYKSFNNNYYLVSDMDVKPNTPNVTILSRNNKQRDAYILDHSVGMDIDYDNGPSYKKNIILIGNSNDRNTSESVSVGGDSGSCVYHKASGKLIGMLLGGNNKFSIVLPIQETLNSFNLITL